MQTRNSPKHAFRFTLPDGRVMTAWANVVRGKKSVEFDLTEQHVLKSIRLKGIGNTQTCSAAICTLDHADAFPHPVEGYVDWQYSTAFVVSRVSEKTGMPITCVAYKHCDNIAKLNDSKDGQRRLLADIRANGPRHIHLLPIKYKQSPPNRANPKKYRDRRDGSRSSHPAAVGAKLRFATAQLGGAI